MKKEKPRIPGLAVGFLKRILPKEDSVYLSQNFKELYEYRVKTGGRFKAGIWIWGEILKSLPGFLYSALYWRFMMFKNYFVISIRNIRKHTLHSIINIAGMSMGLFVCLLILCCTSRNLSFFFFFKQKTAYEMLM